MVNSFYNNKKLSIVPSQNQEPVALEALTNLVVPKKEVVTAPIAANIQKKVTANKGVTAPTGGPLDKDKNKNKTKSEEAQKKTNEQVAQEVVDEIPVDSRELSYADKRLQQFRKLNEIMSSMAAGSKLSSRTYQNLLPSVDDFTGALLQGNVAVDDALGGADAVKQSADMTNALKKEALANYLKKADNPYRGVDVEGTLSTITNKFGMKPSGLRNAPDAISEFNVLKGTAGDDIEQQQLRAKNIMSYMNSVLRPQLMGEDVIQREEKKLGGGGAGGVKPTDEWKVTEAYRKPYSKLLEADQIYGTIKQNISSGDLLSLQASLSLLAKGVGKEVGNLAVKEADRFVPASLNMSMAKFIAYIASNPQYKVPKESLQGIKMYVDASEKEVKKKFSKELTTIRETLRNSPNYATTSERLWNDVYGREVSALSAQGDKADKKKAIIEKLRNK